MTDRHWPIAYWPLVFFPEGFWAGGDTVGYHLYAGADAPSALDYETPVALIAAGADWARASGLGLAGGSRTVFALRAISSRGVEERNTHVLALADLDGESQLLAAPLVAAYDVTAEGRAGGTVLVGFSYLVPGGHAAPTKFEVFCDHGAGAFDLQQPAAVVTFVDGRADYETLVGSEALPATVAVRPANAQRIGPMSDSAVAPLQDPAVVPEALEEN